MNKALTTIILILLLALSLSACGGTTASETNDTIDTNETMTESEAASDMKMMIGDTEVSVEWEENESVEALMELAGNEPLTIQMSMYGGFEQVGSIGTSLPRNDQQITTNAGDIVLYSGDQIVILYGSNSWSYTRLGHISDQSEQELAELLGSGNVMITIGR